MIVLGDKTVIMPYDLQTAQSLSAATQEAKGRQTAVPISSLSAFQRLLTFSEFVK